MPGRETPLINGGIYHIFNKTIDSKKVFLNPHDSDIFLDIIKYYRSNKPIFSYSRFRKLQDDMRDYLLEELSFKKFFQIELLCYCLMPTHFHFLIRQKKENGTSRFVADVTNSFTRYHNLKAERKGPIFLQRFRAERIMSQEHLIHVSRYIHLNPYSSQIVQNYDQLETYRWSSLKEYLSGKAHLAEPKYLLKIFGDDSSRYRNFVLSNAEYQRTLEYCKHTKKW